MASLAGALWGWGGVEFKKFHKLMDEVCPDLTISFSHSLIL